MGDITYIRRYEGWCYLACVLDLGSREIVGYATSRIADTALAKAALDNAIKQSVIDCRQLLFHSDQGCQYSSSAFRRHLKTLGIKQSMRQLLGQCGMERFFRNVKTEYLNPVDIMNFYRTTLVQQLIGEYIRFYNFKRLHSAIDYLTPHQKGNNLRNVA